MRGNEERRAVIQVTDRPIEVQSMLQTVFTFIIIGVLSWIGLTLEKVKDLSSENNKAIAVFSSQLTTQQRDFERHIIDPRAHSK